MKTLVPSIYGATLPEVIVTATIMAFVCGAVTVAGFGLHRSFSAAQDFSVAHLEQVRVMDELKRDARVASEVNAGAGGSSDPVLHLVIPTTDPGLISLELPSSVLGLLTVVLPSATTKTVDYRFVDGAIRRVEVSDMREVGSRQTRFEAAPTGTGVKATVAFPSKFKLQPSEVPASTLSVEVPRR